MTPRDLSEQFSVGQRSYLGGGFGGSGSVEGLWPHFCERVGLVVRLSETMVEHPPLRSVDEPRPGLERWRIGLPGRFDDDGDKVPRVIIPKLLLSSREGAQAVHGHQPGPAELEVLVSYRRWPEILPFDPALIPVEPQRVVVGEAIDGAPVLWDLASQCHGLIAGRNNSGKSEAFRMIAVQLLVKGWGLDIVTAKLDDPVLSGFADHGAGFYTGISDAAVEAAADLFADLRADRTARQAVQAEHGARKWAQLPAEVLANWPFRLVTIDEPRGFFLDDKGDSAERKRAKSAIRSGWNELLQEGRSAGQHGLILNQSVNVDSLGGGFAQEQIGMRLAVRSLDRKWWPVVFPESVADLSLLSRDSTPPGRAIGRGLIAPGTVFGSEDVQDAPLQVPLLDDATCDGLLSGSIPWGHGPALSVDDDEADFWTPERRAAAALDDETDRRAAAAVRAETLFFAPVVVLALVVVVLVGAVVS